MPKRGSVGGTSGTAVAPEYREILATPVPDFDLIGLTRQREAEQHEEQRQAWIQHHRNLAAVHSELADEAEDDGRAQAHLGIALSHQRKADRLEGRYG